MQLNFPIISVNGVLDAAISPLDRGFAYGDGIFETCRYHRGVIPLWDYHLERLLHSAERLKIPIDLPRLMIYKDELLDIAEAGSISDAVLKITVTRGIGGRGYRQPLVIKPTYCMGLFSGNDLQSPNFCQGVAIRTCDLRLSSNESLAGMKHLNRLEHILARAEWQDEFAEGILLDQHGHVIEATVSNLFVVKNGELFTPSLSRCGVAGIMRRLLIEHISVAEAMPCHIVDMEFDSFVKADEILLCNSIYGIWPVNLLHDRLTSGSGNEILFPDHHVTLRLQQRLLALLNEF